VIDSHKEINSKSDVLYTNFIIGVWITSKFSPVIVNLNPPLKRMFDLIDMKILICTLEWISVDTNHLLLDYFDIEKMFFLFARNYY
jgi:hypothetical protein